MLRYLLLVASVLSIFQDQIGLYDWYRQNIGKPQDIYPVSAGRTILISTRSVMSLLSPTGEILWRRILTKLDSKPLSTLTPSGIFTHSSNILTMWTLQDGLITWSTPTPDALQLHSVDHGSLNLSSVLTNNSILFFTTLEGTLSKKIDLIDPIKILGVENDSVFVLCNNKRIQKITLRTWTVEELEFASTDLFWTKDSWVSVDESTVYVFKAGTVKKFEWNLEEKIRTSSDKYLIAGKKIVEIQESGAKVVGSVQEGVYCENHFAWVQFNNNKLTINRPGSEVITLEHNEKDLEVQRFLAYSNSKGELLGFIQFKDFSILSFRDSKVRWVREEGLGHLTSLYFMELPTKEMHSHNMYFNNLQMHNNWEDVIENLILRVQSQLTQPGLKVEPLERDNFSLKKLILAFSQSGYLYAIQSQDSKIYWKRGIPGIFSVIQTGPEEAKVLSNDGVSTFVHTINIITGETLQTQSWAFSTEKLLVSGENENLSIQLMTPDNTLAPVFGLKPSKVNFFEVNTQKSSIEGFEFSEGLAKLTWSLNLPKNEQISVIVSNKAGKIHQPAIATGSSRLIYKYLDSNLFAIASQKSTDLYIYIINSISGHIVYRIHQESVKGKVHLAFHEHKLYAHYFSQKFDRFEILSVEIFKSEVEYSAGEILKKYYSDGFATEITSKWTPELNVFTQTYIFPYPVQGMKVTQTAQGITKPVLILILESGDVYLLDCSFLSPRRKYEDKSEDGLFDEVGLPVYKPILPFSYLQQSNYNLTLEGLNQIELTQAALESTCIAAFFGLDLFIYRIMPEKSFDALPDDFNKSAIVLSISLLVILNIVAHKWFSFKTAQEKFNH